MSSFRFKLQSVQLLRERLRDQAAESLHQAHLALQKLSEQLQQLQQEISDQSVLQSQASVGTIDTQRVIESQRYQLQLMAQSQVIQDNIALIEQECERRQLQLVKREQDVRVLEKLRESQLQQWHHSQALSQQSRLDEWSSFQFWKRSNDLDLPAGTTAHADHQILGQEPKIDGGIL